MIRSDFPSRINLITSRVPFIKAWSPAVRLLAAASLILLPLIVVLFILTTPSTEEMLREHTWCVTGMRSGNQEYQPFTVSGPVRIVFDQCNETMSFAKSGMELPGFNSAPVTARWSLTGDSIIITGATNFKTFYEGKYEVRVDANSIRLVSGSLTITGVKQPKYLWGN